MLALPAVSAALALMLIAGEAPQRVEGEVAWWHVPKGAGKGGGTGGGKGKTPRRITKIPLAGVEVRFIPAAAAEPVFHERLERARREIAAARPAVAELSAEASRAQGEALQALELATQGQDATTAERWAATSQVSGDAIARYQAARNAMLVPTRGPYYLADLPPAAGAATTGVDGKFSAELPAGRYAVVASARRQPSDPEEIFHWLLWVTIRGREPSKVALGSDNLVGTSCPSCVVPVKELVRGLP